MKLRSDTWKEAGRHLRVLGEGLLFIVLVWLLLGWWFDEPLLRDDGPRLFAPYLRSALEAGPDWTNNLYRFGVFGGSAMHPAFGTSPLVLACSALGISPTMASNLGVLFEQTCLGFFSIVIIEALIAGWSGDCRQLSRFERSVTMACCAFAPVVGWRIAAGHENLIQGLLPFVAALSLWWSARARTLSLTSLLVGWLAVCHGLPSLGQQSMVYSIVFGAPVVAVTLFGEDKRRLRAREHMCAAIALVGAALFVLPLVWVMLRYQLGDDASRGVSRSMFHSYGQPYVRDWLASLPWTTAASAHWPGKIPAHETNYPLGPLVLFALMLWPRGTRRELGLALLASLVLAVAFSLDLDPVAPLLRRIPLVDAFRVPARAVLPVIVMIPIVALAVLWSRWRDPFIGRRGWGLAVGGAVAILVAPSLPSIAREIAAWLACASLCVALRNEVSPLHSAWLASAIAVVGALGISSFAERYSTVPPAKRIEDEPSMLREKVLRAAPELAMPLTRVQVPDRDPPFGKSTAFAAGLPTLDGVGFPPRRFLRLLSALWNEPVSAAESDFELTHRDRFDILAQLYNVQYLVESGQVTKLPATNGAAWFTRDLFVIDDPRAMIRVLRTRGVDVRETLARVAWVLRDEQLGMVRGDPDCSSARVKSVNTDRLGQTAYIDVDVNRTCVLVIATNYSSLLRSTDGVRPLVTFPVDIALTGVVVPAGTTRVEVRPQIHHEWWWAVLGGFLLLLALVMLALSRTETLDAAQGSGASSRS